jgi:peptidoglycan hydrolase CwlO-like protein
MYDMFPSYRNDLYTYLTNNLILLKQIGSGAGSSVIIKTYKPTNQTIIDEINSFCSIDSQVQSINSTISKVSSVLQKQNLDIQFMNEYISKLENLVTTLSNQLESERKQGVNGFYRTWH